MRSYVKASEAMFAVLNNITTNDLVYAAVDPATGTRSTHVTRHTSHVTRHTSHITRNIRTRHTSHVTHHTPHTPHHPPPPSASFTPLHSINVSPNWFENLGSPSAYDPASQLL